MKATQLHAWTNLFNFAHELATSGIDSEEIVQSLAQEIRPAASPLAPVAWPQPTNLLELAPSPVPKEPDLEPPTISLIHALKVWLGLPTNPQRRIQPAALHRELLDLGLPVPARSRQFGQLMTANYLALLGQLGCVETRSHGYRSFTFKPTETVATSCRALRNAHLSVQAPRQQAVNGMVTTASSLAAVPSPPRLQ
jgi:hypothetical protein